jgi:hypothetical protein
MPRFPPHHTLFMMDSSSSDDGFSTAARPTSLPQFLIFVGILAITSRKSVPLLLGLAEAPLRRRCRLLPAADSQSALDVDLHVRNTTFPSSPPSAHTSAQCSAAKIARQRSSFPHHHNRDGPGRIRGSHTFPLPLHKFIHMQMQMQMQSPFFRGRGFPRAGLKS